MPGPVQQEMSAESVSRVDPVSHSDKQHRLGRILRGAAPCRDQSTPRVRQHKEWGQSGENRAGGYWVQLLVPVITYYINTKSGDNQVRTGLVGTGFNSWYQ